MPLRLLCFLPLLSPFASSVMAQKMPDPRDHSRVVQLHDVEAFAERVSPGTTVGADGLCGIDRCLLASARFARAFCTPPMQPEEDVSPLALRYLVAIARPQQQAWIEKWLRARREDVAEQVDLCVRQFEVREGFERLVEPLLAAPLTEIPDPTSGAKRSSAPILAEAVPRLQERLASSADVLVGPTLKRTWSTIVARSFRAGRTIPYVRDYDVEIGSAEAKATPIHDVVFDGLEVDAVCGRLANDEIAITMRASIAHVEQPIATFETAVGDAKLVIELPSVTTRHSDWHLTFPENAAAVCVIDTPDSRLVFLVQARIAEPRPQRPAK